MQGKCRGSVFYPCCCLAVDTVSGCDARSLSASFCAKQDHITQAPEAFCFCNIRLKHVEKLKIFWSSQKKKFHVVTPSSGKCNSQLCSTWHKILKATCFCWLMLPKSGWGWGSRISVTGEDSSVSWKNCAQTRSFSWFTTASAVDWQSHYGAVHWHWLLQINPSVRPRTIYHEINIDFISRCKILVNRWIVDLCELSQAEKLPSLWIYKEYRYL